MDTAIYTPQYLRKTNPKIFKLIARAGDLEELRGQLIDFTFSTEQKALEEANHEDAGFAARIRDCGIVLRTLLTHGSEQAAGFSILQVLWDIGHNVSRPELSPAFYADLYHLLLGVLGQGPRASLDVVHLAAISASGRKAALIRSRQLDNLWNEVDQRMDAFPTGLGREAVEPPSAAAGEDSDRAGRHHRGLA